MIISEGKFNVDLTPEIIQESLIDIESSGAYVVYYNIYNGNLRFISNGQSPYFGLKLCTINIVLDDKLDIIESIYEKYLNYVSSINTLYLNNSLNIKKCYNDIVLGKISINYFADDPKYNIVGKQLIKKAELFGGINEDVFPLLINIDG